MKTLGNPHKIILVLTLFVLVTWSCHKTKDPAADLKVGDEYQGGYICYFLHYGDNGYTNDRLHGFIAAKNDLPDTFAWCDKVVKTQASGWALNSGRPNTGLIVSAQGNAVYAAKAASQYTVGQYADWYLPSRDELYQMRYYATPKMNFHPGSYWSSMEDEDTTQAWSQDWESGYQKAVDKKQFLRVRPIRSF